MNQKNKKIKVEDIVDKKVPDNIRILFGRFTFYSIMIIFFLSIIYSLILVKYLSLFTAIGILVILFLFYLYMIYDVIKHKDTYSSVLFVILIIATVLSFGISILKLFHLY